MEEEPDEDEYEKTQKNLNAFLLCLNDEDQTAKHLTLLDMEFYISKPGCPKNQ